MGGCREHHGFGVHDVIVDKAKLFNRDPFEAVDRSHNIGRAHTISKPKDELIDHQTPARLEDLDTDQVGSSGTNSGRDGTKGARSVAQPHAHDERTNAGLRRSGGAEGGRRIGHWARHGQHVRPRRRRGNTRFVNSNRKFAKSNLPEPARLRAMTPTSVVSTRGLHMQFGHHVALHDLTVDISHGVTGLVGANGAGKTTLFNLWLGLIAPTAGVVEVGGLDPVAHGAVVRSRIGFSPERNILPNDMAAHEFVRHLGEVKGLPRSEARGRASDALWLVGLGEERFRPLGTMSTGQRQRVKLAQALASDPQLILLDEPTDGLDPMQRDEMLKLIADIHRSVGIDIVVSSHVLEEVERVCTDVVILDGGRLIAAGAVSELLAQTLAGVVVELVETDDHTSSVEQVTQLLIDRGFAVESLPTNNPGAIELLVTTARTDDVDTDLILDAVRDAVANAGARIHALGGRRVTLEDVFLTAGAHHG